ncbi:MAG TPA: ribosome biogenesis GTP-binding protein YihA/YsxC [Steroidobacteraceae bacterium]|nr:ribosome biogenesis GTP-binding protein YihA/YsxC [Steroidobacteraceae bacterium]
MSAYPTARFLLSVGPSAQFPPDEGREVAAAGRSNAGKSSALNSIAGRRSLARTSKTPGRTRLLNYFELADGQRLVDLPGYGYADAGPAERADWARLIEALSQRASLAGLLLIVDVRRGLQEGDFGLLDWAGGLPVQVLLSKCDKLTRSQQQKALADARAQLQNRAAVQLFSAVSGEGVTEARGVLDRWLLKRNPGDPALLGG